MSYSLHLGDCLEIMKTMADKSVDAVITDLPYGTTACAWDEVIPFVSMWAEVKRVLKPNGAFVTTASQPFTSKLIMSNLEWFKYVWVWKKSLGTRALDANWRPLLFHEDVVVFGEGRLTYNPQKWAGAVNHGCRTRKPPKSNVTGSLKERSEQDMSGMKYPRTIIEIDSLPSVGRDHPTQKPVALYSYLILTYTNPGDTVLDFAAGSFTTGVACLETGRNFIGIEKDESYFKIGKRRIEDAAAQPMLFATT